MDLQKVREYIDTMANPFGDIFRLNLAKARKGLREAVDGFDDWTLERIKHGDDRCVCGQPVKWTMIFRSEKAGREINVGGICAKYFRTYRILKQVKRITRDRLHSINDEDVLLYFAQIGLINIWEFKFLVDTMRKRDLTPRQKFTRIKLNRRIICRYMPEKCEKKIRIIKI